MRGFLRRKKARQSVPGMFRTWRVLGKRKYYTDRFLVRVVMMLVLVVPIVMAGEMMD
jgi:hypothetical protein